MPGSIWFPFRRGDRSEYHALHILSALGIAFYVPRTEDIGVDFYCSLAVIQPEISDKAKLRGAGGRKATGPQMMDSRVAEI
jgi:hypothetical protein